eukprot:TRINITY_DN4215_c0_g1_i1.p1 TRINITY_DN4215_c0_g1~~TRINITY_DN4215_c0_g1_i1.p1  ORF type:complete len:129 (-),score=20.34 TRINITY_DN4215_c0_g1_i1:157-543(-)
MEDALSITMTVKKNSPNDLIQDLIDQADQAHCKKEFVIAHALYEAINEYAENYHVLYQLGVYSMEGYDVKSNEERALEFFTQAKALAELLPEEDHALFILGEMYVNGYGTCSPYRSSTQQNLYRSPKR